MTTEAFVLIVHAVSAASAGIVYSLWGYKWARYRKPVLATLNICLACAGYLFAAWFTFALLELPRTVLRPGVVWAIPVLLLGPAVVRFLELQSMERTEAFAKAVKTRLGGR